MERLYKGIRKFQKAHFGKGDDFFRRLSREQRPEVLFVTCSDSRVDPNLMTESKPGELFILRNVGNIIPPLDAGRDKNSVAAALEYAVLALKVTDIIVCGHSGCGAMRALWEGRFQGMPHLGEWLETASPAMEAVGGLHASSSDDGLLRAVEEENVLFQLKNLGTYPFIAEGGVELHGWYYVIGTGDIYEYNPRKRKFDKITCLPENAEEVS